MNGEITITDPIYENTNTKHNFLDRFFLKLINDKRDLVFIHLSLGLLCFAIPFTVYFYSAQSITWWVALIYLLVNWSLLMGPYILMLHCTSHRKLFKNEFGWLNHFIPWVLGPFFGESPETYFAHHIGMHHPENNMKDDLSSTIPYQRDSFKDFMTYFLRFFFLSIPNLGKYFIKKKRRKLMIRALRGEVFWFVLVILLGFINLQATILIFVIPLCFTRFMMMAGNWAQHAFIDADDPGNCYRNSITCINVLYNKQCFNDGYHIVHHLKPNMHYTDMPREFLANLNTYAKEKAVVFEGVDFFMIWLMLMFKNYKFLAKKFVDLGEKARSNDEVVSFLKSRTRRIAA